MSEKFSNHFDVNTPISPFIPRGRGVSTNSLCTGEPTSTVCNGSHSRMAFKMHEVLDVVCFFKTRLCSTMLNTRLPHVVQIVIVKFWIV